MILKFFFF